MVFLSYSHSDIVLARQLEKRLREAGIPCWFDESQIPVGEMFVSAIGDALRSARVLLAIDSQAAAASYWVNREIQAAERLRSQNHVPAIVVLSTSESQFLLCDPDIRALCVDLVAHSVCQFVAGTSKPDTGKGDLEEVSVFDQYHEDARWLGFSQELRCLDSWWFGGSFGMWICGPAGSGKTSLARTWVRAFQKIGYRKRQKVLATSFHLHEDSGDSDAFLGELVDHLFNHLGIEPFTTKPRQYPLPDAFYRVRHELEVRAKQGVLVLNSPESIDAAELLKGLNGVHTCGLRVIVTARKPLPRELKGSGFDTITLSKMSDADARLLIAGLVQGQEADPIAARLSDSLHGNPLAINLVIERMQEYGVAPTSAALEDFQRLLTSDAGGAAESDYREKVVKRFLSETRASLERTAADSN